ncbi:MAG: ATP-binding cassette domain-containing protein [Verrucomicrobia bacterium]|jgi:molybdate/tungstate transport system ATP-binding protein|nr:ATP-binding cassette domain-containing protein [Verrucomicrobiota bacterium]MBT7066714.1 ATP-binding cassette domain-containing protein [Verrucomicrobiota bacterium]MBT7700795.1 ATP-binding cassette domain-containing protein [Verrucomicrobiota bacterium]
MIVLDHVSIEQDAFRMQDVCIEVPRGAYAVLMGATGSGKTTLLEVICGLRRPTAGRILLGGEDLTDATPAGRDVGYVPQDGALFKTMTVFEQLAFALMVRRENPEIIEARVIELAELLGIQHLLDRTPDGLSGGECQRVGLGRALSFRPRILLLDEPLCALDDETRSQIVDLLRQVREHTGVTTLHVTHNKSEADQLGTMGLRIENGCVLPLAM